MEFVIYCLDKPDGADARRRARMAHLEFEIKHQGSFKYGGPLLSPDGETKGSLAVMSFSNRAALDEYLAEDPYFKSNLFASVTIWNSRQVVPELAPGLLQTELVKQRAIDATDNRDAPHLR
jgi:uncharacterized protein YciI